MFIAFFAHQQPLRKWSGHYMAKKNQYGIKRPLKKLLPFLLEAQDQNLNEADTVLRIVKVFEDVLGYSAMTEITREAQVRDKYVDLALKIDDVIRLLVEVKRAGVTLRDRHIEQAYHYASRNNYSWVLLTNGVVWNLYHLTFEEGIEYDRAFTVDLRKDDIDKAVASLSVLHRDCIRNGGLDDFWQHQLALSPISIGKAIFHEDVLRNIRKEVRRNAGILIDTEDLAVAIKGMLSQDTREQMGPVKIKRGRKGSSRPRATKVAPAAEIVDVPCVTGQGPEP
jgi:predicted type IV restriction endonuclease